MPEDIRQICDTHTHTHTRSSITIKYHLLIYLTSSSPSDFTYALLHRSPFGAGRLTNTTSHAMPSSNMDSRTAKVIGSWSVFRRRRIRDYVHSRMLPLFREAPSPSMILKRAALPRHSGNGICNRRYHPSSHSGLD
jgi:hypothetical protein